MRKVRRKAEFGSTRGRRLGVGEIKEDHKESETVLLVHENLS